MLSRTPRRHQSDSSLYVVAAYSEYSIAHHVTGNGREHQEEAEFLAYDWIHNSQLYEMEIIWSLPGYGPIPNAHPLRIAFRPYSPKRGPLDVATSVWSNREGQVPSVEQPAYAVYDTANLVVAVERYFSSLQPAIEEWIFARISRDEIAYSTYQEVIRMRRVTGSKALDLAMRLQCLSVVSQGYGSVFSPNIPGIREYDYSRLGRSDYEAYDRGSCDRPLPGAITHQMDVAAVKYLRKLEKLFVKELAALIFKPKIKPWYELFLTFYVIFWNLEYIHHGAQDYIKSKNGTVSPYNWLRGLSFFANLPLVARKPSQQRSHDADQKMGICLSRSPVPLALHSPWLLALQTGTRQPGRITRTWPH